MLMNEADPYLFPRPSRAADDALPGCAAMPQEAIVRIGS
jgi:hypothetical protein